MYNGSLIPESSLQAIPLQPSADGIKIHLFDRQREPFRLLFDRQTLCLCQPMADILRQNNEQHHQRGADFGNRA